MWKKMTLGIRIAVGFVVVLVLMAIISFISFNGFQDVVKVIKGNQLDGTLVQKEIDHLNWANKVNALLTDEHVTSLAVETDDHKCAFGEWLYGNESAKTVTIIPELAPLLEKIEEPHRKLHESAVDIAAAFRQPHQGLSITLANLLKDHIAWSKQISTTLALESGNLYTYQARVKNAVNQAISTIKYYAENESLGDMQTRQTLALQVLKSMRYGPDGNAYFWINDTTPRMVMHPYQPELEGADLSENKDSNGKSLFIEMVSVGQQKGEGFVTYYWPKNGADKPVPKISYVKLYKPWDWIIGSGVYLDHSNKGLLARAEEFAAGKPFSLGVQTDSDKCELGKFLAAPSTAKLCTEFPELNKILESIREPHKRLHSSAKEIEQLITETNVEQALKVYEHKTEKTLREVAALLQEAIAVEGKLQEGFMVANTIYADQTLPSLTEVQSLIGQIRGEAGKHVLSDEAMLQSAQNYKITISAISIAAIILGIGLAVFISRGIIKLLTNVSDQMSNSADQVVSASGQVSSASQSLAEGTSEQAASIEETSSSLEEMSSMTKQNAHNAGQADTLMKEADSVVAKANETMSELTTSMEDISKASEETSKIIKTIDEIAFQTNLLALNAAVEAARAGEAGAGFAVVADEVRNLAMRAADAAKNTASMIESTIKKVKDGSDLVTRTNQAFCNVSESTSKVGELVAEITAASNEQALGIDQVNTAVAEMDKVVQQNAANAEESAAAAEELGAQAVQMRSIVYKLLILVGRSSRNEKYDSEKEESSSHSGRSANKEIRIFTTSEAREVGPDTVVDVSHADYKDF